MTMAIRTCSAEDLYVHTNSNPSDLPGLNTFASRIALSISDALSQTFGYRYKLKTMSHPVARLSVNDGFTHAGMIEFQIWVASSSLQLQILLPANMWDQIVESFFGGSRIQARNEPRDQVKIHQGAHQFLYSECQKNLATHLESIAGQWFHELGIKAFEGPGYSRHWISYDFTMDVHGIEFSFLISIPSAFVNKFWVHLNDVSGKGEGSKRINYDIIDPLEANQEVIATINIQNVEIQKIFDASSGQMLLLGEMSNVFVTLEYAGSAIGIGKLIERNGKYALQIATT